MYSLVDALKPWHARRDSNPWPLPPEGNALSSWATGATVYAIGVLHGAQKTTWTSTRLCLTRTWILRVYHSTTWAIIFIIIHNFLGKNNTALWACVTPPGHTMVITGIVVLIVETTMMHNVCRPKKRSRTDNKCVGPILCFIRLCRPMGQNRPIIKEKTMENRVPVHCACPFRWPCGDAIVHAPPWVDSTHNQAQCSGDGYNSCANTGSRIGPHITGTRHGAYCVVALVLVGLSSLDAHCICYPCTQCRSMVIGV